MHMRNISTQHVYYFKFSPLKYEGLAERHLSNDKLGTR
nr:MAG TPA: hypothetical protein [Bacteriophage sp.]